MKSFAKTITLTFAALFTWTEIASAAPITVPAGETGAYRLVFQTSVKRNAFSSNIADYNAFVTSVANSVAALAGLGTTWTAIASTSAVDARDNTNTNPFTDGTGVPIYNLFGVKMADDNADLWDGVLSGGLNGWSYEDGSGIPLGQNSVWTGSEGDGTGALFRTLGVSAPYVGLNRTTSVPLWIHWAVSSASSQYGLYAMSGVLSVSVPTPGAALLLGVGLLGVAARRQRLH